MFARRIGAGDSTTDAVAAVADAYLNGKPARRGKYKISAAERHAAFWTSDFLAGLSADAYLVESLVLALARYMGQDRTSNAELIEHIVSVAPEAVRRAARYSGLVRRQDSPRWNEIERLAATHKPELGELVRIFHAFDIAHRERLAEVAEFRRPLAGLSPFELLIYASLFGFERLVPSIISQGSQVTDPDADKTQEIWDATNAILLWKLKISPADTFHLTDEAIG